MSLEELSLDYKKLLDFICQSEDVDSIRKLFESMDGFWQSEYYCSPMIVYSINKDSSGSLEGQYRTFWNKDKESIFYTDKEVEKVLSMIQKDGPIRKWDCFSLENIHYYLLHCGAANGQEYFAIHKSDRKINNVVMDYLIQFLETTFTKLNRYDEVSELKNLIHVDDVTDLYNQRKFSLDIDELIESYNLNKQSFSIIFVDIDHFKKVNDGHGHLVGTTLLKEVGVIIKDCVRNTDSCYRYGGDEFVLLIPESDLSLAKKIGERILNKISKKEFKITEDMSLENGEKTFRLSVSVGVATFPDNANSKNEIIKIADQMMYAAKKSGRSRVCVANEIIEEE
ncbi:GGDEF domain-containing protein [Halobacteriovorax sp. GB3]|uniref:GGDEF domain-containing protein n=1 Tax=Halobacteriovorax sp. GB3 TaxID=2719615 RepID=UPI00235F7C67|nr:GGDEF domain-containing protein [Halobacteriovorax sp. GB3]MDD0853499.1 GGDEF domain-containing protein [Halobacteriovorax sp. GB3]